MLGSDAIEKGPLSLLPLKVYDIRKTQRKRDKLINWVNRANRILCWEIEMGDGGG